MELTTATLELIKETTEEIAKEVGKAAKDVTDFGKIGSVATTEQISLGKLDANESEKQMMFGSDKDMFADEELSSTFGKHNEINRSLVENDIPDSCDILLEPQISFQGGLSACNWKCIQSYCYPVNIAKGIGTKKPHAPNSKIGHT